jgi:NitT/TauT family transport system substrate-binding protein
MCKPAFASVDKAAGRVLTWFHLQPSGNQMNHLARLPEDLSAAAMRRRTFTKAAVALAAPALLSSRNAFAAEDVLKIAEVVRSHFFLPYYVALGKGFAREQGLSAELVTTNGGSKAGALVLGGGADIGLAGPEIPVYVYNSESRDKFALIASLTGTDGFFLASRSKMDNFDWSKVKGKILSYSEGSTPTLCLEHVLRKKGMSPQAVKEALITNVGIPARDGAWLSGQGDFGLFQEPNLSKLEKLGKAFPVASIGHELGRCDYTAFFAKRSWLAENKDKAQRWVNAIARGQAYSASADPKELAEIIKPYFPASTVEDNLAVINRYRNAGAPIWPTNPMPDREGMQRLQQIMVEGGTLPAAGVVAYEKIVDTSFAAAAMKKS